MCVALVSFAMRLSETITIHLAVGASFGVYYFFRERNSGSRLQALLMAARAAILWPLTAAKILLSRQRSGVDSSAAAADQASARFIAKIEDARRKLTASLYRIVELAQASAIKESAWAEQTSRAIRESIEKYVELTIAAAEMSVDAPPSEREMETARVAGRRGKDLQLAGRCIRRRNAMRLVTHQARARTELLHALAEIREIVGNATELTNVTPARHLSVEAVRFYGHAFNLLSLLEDESAATSIARLLDAECTRLRRLEALNLQGSQTTGEELYFGGEGVPSVRVVSPSARARWYD